MRLTALSVRDFGCIETADVSMGTGLNVLYGPNDLGKSTMLEAIRTVLLVPYSSATADERKPWGTDATPKVTLSLVDREGRHWRVKKAFGRASRGFATLEWSNDGTSWSLEAKGKAVDPKLRDLLQWGVPEAGLKGARGMPTSFLTTVLVGPQLSPGAVLGTSLAGDRSEDGKQRLTGALEALAQDPLFKAVLSGAQLEVDKAFTPGGKKRGGLKSPFRRIGDRIKMLEDEVRELSERVNDSEDVRTTIEANENNRIEALSDRDQARASVTRHDEALQRARARAEAQAALGVAEAALAEIDEARESLSNLEDQRHDLAAGRPDVESAVERAAAARAEAEANVERARNRLEEIEQGGEAEGKLRRQALVNRRLELEAKRKEAYERSRSASEAKARAEELDELTAKGEGLAADLQRRTRDHGRSEKERREAEAARRALDGAIALRRLEEARARLAQAETSQAQSKSWREQASTKRAQADAIVAEVEALGLPDPGTLAALEALERELRLAQARLGGGLSVTVRLSDETVVATATADDGTARPIAHGASVEAERALRVQLEGLAEVDVVAGEAQARAEAEALRDRHQTEVAPLLQRLHHDDLEAVRAARTAADHRLEEARAASDAAALLSTRAEAGATDTEGLERARALVDSRQAALAAFDPATAREAAGELDEAGLTVARTQAESRMEEAGRTAERLALARAELAAEAEELQRRHAHLAQVQREALARLEGDDAEVIAERAGDELAAAEGALEQVHQDLADLDRASQAQVARAQSDVVRAQQVAAQARDNEKLARQRLEGVIKELANTDGKLEALQARLAKMDRDAARVEVDKRREGLAALPAPEIDTDEEARAAAARTLEAAERRVRELDQALDKARGALQQVGGNVVRDEHRERREALDAAQREEAEIELEYAAYQLLTDTLRETEIAEGRHLGQALAAPVAQRFAALTGGRYGALELDAQLGTHGLHAAGDVRPIDALSAGLQEQLATLLRLAVAEQLGTALVLDDHLTQTDPDRIAWFRDALVGAAGSTQIVVLTCRPEDYLESPPRAGVTAIDLGAAIRRMDPAAAS